MHQINDKGVTLEILNLLSLNGIEDDNLRKLLNSLIIELFKCAAEYECKQKRITYEKIVEMLEKDVQASQIFKELDLARNIIYRLRDEIDR